jgi:hypothetical protein
MKDFTELKSSNLCSKPVVDYPQKQYPYNLIMRSSPDQVPVPGVLSIILTQTNMKTKYVAYATWKLQKHEKNYPPYILELLVWGMDHYAPYLKG